MTINTKFIFKEVGLRNQDIAELDRLADNLIASQYASKIQVWFEFENSAELKNWCQAVKMLPYIKEIKELDDALVTKRNTLDELQTEIQKLREKKADAENAAPKE